MDAEVSFTPVSQLELLVTGGRDASKNVIKSYNPIKSTVDSRQSMLNYDGSEL